MENISFGKIKDNIIKQAIDFSMINEKKTIEITNKFIQLIKESEILKLQNELYHNVNETTINDSTLGVEFIKESIKKLNKFTSEEIINENKKLLELYDENIGNIGKTKLYEATHDIITNNNTSKIFESYDIILDNLKKDKSEKTLNENIEYDILNEDIIKIAIDKFNKKYGELLNEDDKSLLNIIIKNKNNHIIFNELKNETISLLENVENDGIEDKLNETIDKINEMKDSDLDNIIKLHELKKDLL